MDSLITDALNFSKVMRQEIPLQPVDVAALLHGIMESYTQLQHPKAHVNIEENILPLLGNTAGLTQRFSNLLGNAVKFVSPGQPPTVRVWAEPRGHWVRIWVEDNGIGIAKEYQDQIFVLFQKLDNNSDGTGVGLALVHKVVERMKGKIGVESEQGQGSRFWIERSESAAE